MKYLLLSFLLVLTIITNAQIASWDFAGESLGATSTAEVFNANLDASNLLTRGPGATASAGANSFRTVDFQNNGISTANTDYFQNTLSAAPGYLLSLSSIDARFAGTTSFSNSPGVTMQYAYSLDGTNFTLIGTPFVQIGNGAMAQIDLSGITALQNVTDDITVTIRLYASGQTTTGGWGYNSASTAGTIGLAFGGTVSLPAGCATTSSITPSACVSYDSPSGNYNWTASGIYKDTIDNAAMCDSVITIDLTIFQPETVSTTVSICPGQTYIFGSLTLTDANAGLHTQVFPNMNTCDSTVNLTLSVISAYNETATATICEGETYIFGAQNLTTEVGNPYIESFTSIGGCDSTVTLTLTVNPRTYESITVVECNEYISPSGKTWTISNTYNDTIPNANMCDSVITVNLTIKNSTSASISESVCGSYDFLGNTLTSSGIYVDTIDNVAMCDSIITLTLEVTPMPNAPTTSGNVEYCENDVLAGMSATSSTQFGELIIAGIVDGPLSGGTPKVVEFYAIQDIADLSIYGFGSANNGGASGGEEFTFPALSLSAGDHYYVALDSVNFNAFFGFNPNYSEGTASNNNGDDVIELFKNGVVIDVFGELGVDGTGTPWDYMDGWAYRNSNSLPNGGVFNISEWTFSGTNQLEGGTTNITCNVPYPIGTITVSLPTSTITWYSDATLLTSIGTSATQTPTSTAVGTTTYYVTETITGTTTCESSASMVAITINANPTVSFSALSDICENASNYTLIEGAPAGGVYSGTGVTAGIFNPSTAGAGTETLTYTYTDGNDCSASATQSITVNATPTVTFGALSDVCVYNPSFALTGGLPTGGTYSGFGVTAGNFNPATAGLDTHILTYSYTDGNGCEGTATSSITVDGCASIDETNTIGLAIFPNPTSGTITVQFEGNLANITVVDVTGKIIDEMTIQSNEMIDLSTLNTGTYFINVNIDGKTSTERVIIK